MKSGSLRMYADKKDQGKDQVSGKGEDKP